MDSDKIIKEFEAIGKSPYTEQFKVELEPAKRAEDWVQKKLQEEFGPIIKADLKEVHFDLLVRKSGDTVEVKYDKKSRSTGNVAIELESYGNRRGIHRSKSTYYAIVCFNKSWGMCLIRTGRLKDMIEKENYPEVMAGDNSVTKVKLVPVKDIIKASERKYPIINIL